MQLDTEETAMKIYSLTRLFTIRGDENIAVVVVAENEAGARERAADQCGDEGRDTWLSDAKVKELGTANAGTDPGFACIDCIEGGLAIDFAD